MGSAGESSAFGCHILIIRRSNLGSFDSGGALPQAMCRSAGPPPPSGRALRGMKGR